MLPPAARAHQGQRVLHAEKDTVEIDRDLPLPVSERHVDHGAREPNPGIVDENIEPAEAAAGLGHDRLPVLFARHVVMIVFALASDGVQFAQQARALLVLQVGRDNLRAFARQHQGRASTDAIRGAGYQGDLFLRHAASCHGPVSCLRPFSRLLWREQGGGPRAFWKRFHTSSYAMVQGRYLQAIALYIVSSLR